MTNLKISFSNFYVQRLILLIICGYPVFYFPKRTVSNKPDSKAHSVLRIQTGLKCHWHWGPGRVHGSRSADSLQIFSIFSLSHKITTGGILSKLK